MLIYYKVGNLKKPKALKCALIEDKYLTNFVVEQTLKHGEIHIIDITYKPIKPMRVKINRTTKESLK